MNGIYLEIRNQNFYHISFLNMARIMMHNYYFLPLLFVKLWERPFFVSKVCMLLLLREHKLLTKVCEQDSNKWITEDT
jgi:hypothetical protein